ncbi:Protein phosphatase methylesterase 1 [Porphyridium purpureum]|uniref:protein phosphatase methylesterase-1 n=1 Tax=Porphyridium purpureum TaxID=35688 RepID=A0A5J4YY58_PORPP|nr:Protein phosphatase methylesterase 1 [Porphyridium purpureum]|eukprot:POR5131..scf209_3
MERRSLPIKPNFRTPLRSLGNLPSIPECENEMDESEDGMDMLPRARFGDREAISDSPIAEQNQRQTQDRRRPGAGAGDMPSGVLGGGARPPARPPVMMGRSTHAEKASAGLGIPGHSIATTAVRWDLDPAVEQPLGVTDDVAMAWNGDEGETDWSPLGWETCFDRRSMIQTECETASVSSSSNAPAGGQDMFAVYSAGNLEAECLVLLLHGGGHCALTWGPVARLVADTNQILAVAYDARAHGDSHCHDETDLSAARQVRDAVKVLAALRESMNLRAFEKICVVGHSMGGAIAIKLAASGELGKALFGVAVIDVVEGSALASLPYMQTFLRSRPQHFSSIEDCIKYHVQSNQIRRLDSARVSTSPELSRLSSASAEKQYVWRTNLEQSEPFWRGWFENLSKEFLASDAQKLLILAALDRFDKELTIAQMQGKFQTAMMRGAGHSVHMDKPEETARTLVDFIKRSTRSVMTLPSKLANTKAVPPCC